MFAFCCSNRDKEDGLMLDQIDNEAVRDNNIFESDPHAANIQFELHAYDRTLRDIFDATKMEM